LVAKAQSAPVNSQWRVVIIEDADRMMERTANVLLKAIEEPPPATVWLLCAPSPIDVLTTIRSRCRPVRLRIPSRDAVAQLLMDRDHVGEDRAKWAASVAQSHIGRAKYLALNESADAERKQILAIPGKLTSVGATIRLAGRIVDAAAEAAKARVEGRDAAERSQLLTTLGIEGEKTIPPSARAQIRKLEEEQKRRSVRARNDELDRIFLELMSLYRDILIDRKSTRLNSIHVSISYAVFCLKKKNRSLYASLQNTTASFRHRLMCFCGSYTPMDRSLRQCAHCMQM